MSRNNIALGRPGKQNLLIHIFFILLCCLFVFPVITIISVSISSEMDIMQNGYSIIPRSIDFVAYKYVFENPKQIMDAYKVTIFVSVVATAGGMLMMLMCAYTLSRKGFKYKKILSLYMFFTMLFSGGLIPKYILMTKYLQLTDTIWVLVVSGLVNVWYIFILRAFIQELDDAIIESALIDGAWEFRIFTSLILPMSKPAIATIGLFVLLTHWNEWMSALLYINKAELYPLQYLLQKVLRDLEVVKQNMNKIPMEFLDQVKVPSETVRMALAIIVAGPMLFIMPFFQKYFVRGITIGSVKG